MLFFSKQLNRIFDLYFDRAPTKIRIIWSSSLKMYPANQKNCQQSQNLISAAQKYVLKLELIFARIASGTVIYLFIADSPQTHFSAPVKSSTAGLPMRTER